MILPPVLYLDRRSRTSCAKMPFVAICGFPSSGKSTRARELESYLCKEKGVNTRIIADCDFGLDKNVIYAGKSVFN